MFTQTFPEFPYEFTNFHQSQKKTIFFTLLSVPTEIPTVTFTTTNSTELLTHEA